MTRRFRTKWISASLIFVFLYVILGAPYQAEGRDDDGEMDCTARVKMSWATKKRLDQIYHEIYMDYYSLIETYSWAGALTRSQKETRLRMLKHYINRIKRANYQWCSEHEPDEWEEEWYNAD